MASYNDGQYTRQTDRQAITSILKLLQNEHKVHSQIDPTA